MTPTIWFLMTIFASIAVSNWWASLYLGWYDSSERSRNWKIAVLTALFCVAIFVGTMYPFAYVHEFGG